MNDGSNALILHLGELEKNKDRGALAALRKGLGKAPGSVPEMFEHVIPYMDRDATMAQEDASFLVASLFASYPEGSGQGNMGATFRTISAATGSDSTEGRFVALLKCHRDDLPDHLRHAVALARSKNATIDWDQLLCDIQNWDDASSSVQRRWARSFWELSRKMEQEKDSEE